jgi:hypothetical protein
MGYIFGIYNIYITVYSDIIFLRIIDEGQSEFFL